MEVPESKWGRVLSLLVDGSGKDWCKVRTSTRKMLTLLPAMPADNLLQLCSTNRTITLAVITGMVNSIILPISFFIHTSS